MKKSLSYFFNLFYPRTCVCCEEVLLDQEELMCLDCRFDLPLVDNGDYHLNAVTKIFEGRVLVEKGASFMYYQEKGKTKQLIHELKYKNNQKIGYFLACWFGNELIESKRFHGFDCIIPVPLHKRKFKKRGYNQLTVFGRQLGVLLAVDYREDLLKRVSFTNTQTKKKRLDRFQNTHAKFVLEKPNFLRNKHILLIDDVVTTGATLEACCKELLSIDQVKISILTMAITG